MAGLRDRLDYCGHRRSSVWASFRRLIPSLRSLSTSSRRKTRVGCPSQLKKVKRLALAPSTRRDRCRGTGSRALPEEWVVAFEKDFTVGQNERRSRGRRYSTKRVRDRRESAERAAVLYLDQVGRRAPVVCRHWESVYSLSFFFGQKVLDDHTQLVTLSEVNRNSEVVE
jgi:hypothetical protein